MVELSLGYCSDTRTKLVVAELNAAPRILQLRGETPRDSKVSGVELLLGSLLFCRRLDGRRSWLRAFLDTTSLASEIVLK